MTARVVLTCALAGLAVLAAVARAHLDDTGAGPGAAAAHMSPMPFLMNVRYGRSSADRRHLEPRTDRFFMGTRYGKRSHYSVEGQGQGQGEGVETALVCRYTGVMALYRCYRSRTEEYEDENSRDEDLSRSMRERERR